MKDSPNPDNQYKIIIKRKFNRLNLLCQFMRENLKENKNPKSLWSIKRKATTSSLRNKGQQKMKKNTRTSHTCRPTKTWMCNNKVTPATSFSSVAWTAVVYHPAHTPKAPLRPKNINKTSSNPPSHTCRKKSSKSRCFRSISSSYLCPWWPITWEAFHRICPKERITLC